MWLIWCWIRILAWISRSCLVINQSLVLDGSLHYLQCVPYSAILQIFYCLARIDTVKFNRLPYPNNKMEDDDVFTVRFRYKLTMFGMLVLIWLSRLFHAHIGYEIDTAEIIAAFFRISYCLHDFIRFNLIVCHVQTARCTMMWFSLIDSDVNWLCLKCVFW